MDNIAEAVAQKRVKGKFSFDATGELYLLTPEATAADIFDQLSGRLSQLSSMLSLVSGDGLRCGCFTSGA